MDDKPSASAFAYGTTRARRASVSYGEVERAATAILRSGKKPTIEGLREALGGGAPDTITSALTRFWKDLGERIEGDPASLSRLPAEVADLAETTWRRALSLAGDAAAQRTGADRTQVEFIKRENELKAHALSLKEKELDALLRSRERTIQELETHLKTTMGFVQQREQTIRALEVRAAGLEAEVHKYGRRLARLVARATQVRTLAARKPSAAVRTKLPLKKGRTQAAVTGTTRSPRRVRRAKRRTIGND